VGEASEGHLPQQDPRLRAAMEGLQLVDPGHELLFCSSSAGDRTRRSRGGPQDPAAGRGSGGSSVASGENGVGTVGKEGMAAHALGHGPAPPAMDAAEGARSWRSGGPRGAPTCGTRGARRGGVRRYQAPPCHREKGRHRALELLTGAAPLHHLHLAACLRRRSTSTSPHRPQGVGAPPRLRPTRLGRGLCACEVLRLSRGRPHLRAPPHGAAGRRGGAGVGRGDGRERLEMEGERR
jgi:hypothetical protein